MEESNQYISLQAAARLCRYSQNYLSLRARQKKLKAQKIGRNWVTTKAWLYEYIAQVGDVKKMNVAKIPEVRPEQKIIKVQQITLPPPENLPIGEPASLFSKKPIFTFVRAEVITVSLFFFVFSSLMFGKEGMFRAMEVAVAQTQNVIEDVAIITGRMDDLSIADIRETVYRFGDEVKENAINTVYNLNAAVQELGEGLEYAVNSPATIGEFTKGYVNWLGETASKSSSAGFNAYWTLDYTISQGLRKDIRAIAEVGSRGFSSASRFFLTFFATEEQVQ